MQIAILIFDKLTALDAIGPYEVLRSVPGWEVKFVGPEKGQVRTDSGALGLSADYSLDEVSEADIVLVPGGEGNRPLLDDEAVLSWLRRIDAGSKWTTSVCTGSLVLGAAGLLEGKRATSHWLFLEQLREFGADPVGGRFVEDGKTITAAGVSAGIDMALHLVGREVGSGGRPGDPARHRVRPPAPLRRRLARQGAGRDRRAGHQRRRLGRGVARRALASAPELYARGSRGLPGIATSSWVLRKPRRRSSGRPRELSATRKVCDLPPREPEGAVADADPHDPGRHAGPGTQRQSCVGAQDDLTGAAFAFGPAAADPDAHGPAARADVLDGQRRQLAAAPC